MKISTLFTYSLNKPTEYVTDFDQRIEMIIYDSILTTFKSSIVFRCSSDSSDNWLESKIEPPSGNLAWPNPWNTMYHYQYQISVSYNFNKASETFLTCPLSQSKVKTYLTTTNVVLAKAIIT